MDKFIELLQSIFLGFVQGATEFLPVSSSGHLAIFKNLFGMDDIGISYDILLHLGTLVAVFFVYWNDIFRLLCDGIGIVIDSGANVMIYIKNKFAEERTPYRKIITNAYRKFALLVIASTIPTGIAGVLIKDYVENLGSTLLIPGICLLITSTLLLISDKLPDRGKVPKTTTFGDAIFIGVAQILALLPGISRSGTTITASLLRGLKREFAVKYSFIMSIPVILGAAVLDLKDFGSDGIGGYTMFTYLMGTIVSAFVGYVCIKTMLRVVRNNKFKYYAYYCFGMGIVCIVGYAVTAII